MPGILCFFLNTNNSLPGCYQPDWWRTLSLVSWTWIFEVRWTSFTFPGKSSFSSLSRSFSSSSTAFNCFPDWNFSSHNCRICPETKLTTLAGGLFVVLNNRWPLSLSLSLLFSFVFVFVFVFVVLNNRWHLFLAFRRDCEIDPRWGLKFGELPAATACVQVRF